MDKYIGKKLDGRYEITELIGVGGMAEVYKGIDVIDNKPVAIKILKKEYAENEEFLRRFRNESKAIAVLSHPNIVKIYDVGFSDKLQYIVMEYIDGITLKEYIEEEKVLTWKDTVHFVIQILRALQHAHDKGIVHRDIKPQNIMMFNDGTIKVMDFGIAKFAREEGKTATDQAIGSVHYISPEQASGDVTDAKSDIYSVGAMMYEMLSGSIELPPADEAVPSGQPAYAAAAAGGRYPQRNQPYGTVDDYYDDDDDDDEEEEERSSLVVPVLTAVVVVVIIVGVIIISLLFTDMLKDSTQKNDWKMPDVVGMDFNDAVSTYGNNILFQEDGQEFNEAEPGIIIEQDIEPGSEFKKGDTLKVKISKGMETAEVPDVKDKNAELAKDILDQLGFECEVRNSSSADVKKGNVIKTEPSAGQQAHKGTTIILYVSIGEDAGQIKADNWVGKPVDEAAAFAEYKGFKVKTKGEASYEPEGQVVRQSIEEGEKVEKGTEITLFFSNGKKPDGEVAFDLDFPAEANGRFVIAFMIQKEDGTIDTQESGTFYCPEYASISQKILGSGENVNVSVSLTNLSNQSRAQIGTYSFNFAEGTSICLSGGDVYAAFENVGGFPEPETDAPPAPTDPPQNVPDPTDPPSYVEPIPGVNGIYGPDGSWVYYTEYVNGEWASDGSGWIWYEGCDPWNGQVPNQW